MICLDWIDRPTIMTIDIMIIDRPILRNIEGYKTITTIIRKWRFRE